MVEVKHLLDYNEKIRHTYFEALEKLSWEEFVKNREASFHSMRNIFVHTLGAVNYWLDFLKKENTRSRKEFDDYTSFRDVQALMEQVEKRTHDYLDSLSTNGLKKKYTVTNDMNETVEVTAEDILIHVFEEEVHHRGELIALLWQMGIEPPLMGWKYL
ncbi:MAG TPA: DinB family protein [Candidatus Eisenbacteria bacterium]|nr:DinB family protein [Candidatus Eisenbacteria bacterium]